MSSSSNGPGTPAPTPEAFIAAYVGERDAGRAIDPAEFRRRFAALGPEKLDELFELMSLLDVVEAGAGTAPPGKPLGRDGLNVKP